MKPVACEHKQATVDMSLVKITDIKGRYMADINIRCADCGLPFRFLGQFPTGASVERPMVGILGTELRLPIEPAPPEVAKAAAALESQLKMVKGQPVEVQCPCCIKGEHDGEGGCVCIEGCPNA